jgi:hypothetical protein
LGFASPFRLPLENERGKLVKVYEHAGDMAFNE